MTCPKCQQEMDRNNLGVVRGWYCWDCDEFVEDEDDHDDGDKVLHTEYHDDYEDWRSQEDGRGDD